MASSFVKAFRLSHTQVPKFYSKPRTLERLELQSVSQSEDQVASTMRVTALLDLIQLLERDSEYIKGIGPKFSACLKKINITNIAGLLLHLPINYIDRRKICPVSEVSPGNVNTLVLKINGISESPSHARVNCEDSTGRQMDLLFFFNRHIYASYMSWVSLKDILRKGEKCVVSGMVSSNSQSGEAEMLQPDIIRPHNEISQVAVIEPQYKLTKSLSNKKMRNAIYEALRLLEDKSKLIGRNWGWDMKYDLLNGNIHENSRNLLEFSSNGELPGILESLKQIHCPKSDEDMIPLGPARTRLAYDEILAQQIVFQVRRHNTKTKHGQVLVSSLPYSAPNSLSQSLIEGMNVKLTESQKAALSEIDKDLQSGERMMRLLQGDVGSGKTLVALISILSVVENGGQGVLLAPTEVLANQHFQTLCEYSAKHLNNKVRIGLLTSAVKGKSRNSLLSDLKDGTIDILVGTHAVYSPTVEFKLLGMAVVDEEHRFGVLQREALIEGNSGSNREYLCHVLYMSATPTPRTLTLARYGDLDVFQLRDKPKGACTNVQTTLVSMSRFDETVERIRAILEDPSMSSHKIFWVVPLAEKSQFASHNHLSDAITRHQVLSAIFGEHRVGLLHGRMNAVEKNRVLSNFSENNSECYRILVATTVVEVGVDVPRARVCIIENAEQFGLSQLHQIRGRIGRAEAGLNLEEVSESPCHCVLLYHNQAGADALRRLQVVSTTNDGFTIAEEDLKLRGPGQVLGVEQNGFDVGFKACNLNFHEAMISEAHTHAKALVSNLSSGNEFASMHRLSLKVLMTLFQYDIEIKRPHFFSVDAINQHTEFDDLIIERTFIKSDSLEMEVSSDKFCEELQDANVHTVELLSEVQKVELHMPSFKKIGTVQSKSDEEIWPFDDSIWKISSESKVEEDLVQSSSVNKVSLTKLPLLDLTVDDYIFVVFDLETTGLHDSHDRIIQIAATVLGSDSSYHKSAFNMYCDPQREIGFHVQSLTGITPKLLKDNGALLFDRTWIQFQSWLLDILSEQKRLKPDRNSGIVMLAHKAGFDLSFLAKEIKRAGFEDLTLGQSGVVAVVDTLAILKNRLIWENLNMEPPINSRLGTIYEHLEGRPMKQAHNAMGDVIGLATVVSRPIIMDKWKEMASSGIGQIRVPSTKEELEMLRQHPTKYGQKHWLI